MKKRNFIGIIIFTVVLFVVFGASCWLEYGTYVLRIREVSSNQTAGEDYIVLVNDGKIPIYICDLYLSDHKKKLQKLPLEDMLLQKGERIVIYPAENDAFGIKASGETIYLSDGINKILQEVKVPKLEENMVYSYMEQEKKWTISSKTVGKENEPVSVVLEQPYFSEESGFYKNPFYLTMSAPKGTKIYYTTDGSVPDETSMIYEKPLYLKNASSQPNQYRSIQNVTEDWKRNSEEVENVDKANVIRAVAIDDDGNQSEVTTATYFVDLEKYKDKTVISLVTDPSLLFDEEKGIYVTGKEYDDWLNNWEKQGYRELTEDEEKEIPVQNYRMHGRDYEIPAVMELYQQENRTKQNVGIRIQGGSTRQGKLKRFSVYSRKSYDDSRYMNADLFDDVATHSFVLRDSLGNALCQELMEGRNVAIQRSIPCVLFLDGEFWYESYIQEKYSKDYLQEYFGVEKENALMIANGMVKEGVESDKELYGEIYAYYSSHDFTKPDVYQEYGRILDYQSYIDFVCANVYLCNMDINENKNYLLWRVRDKQNGKYSDGKWRFLLYDMDCIEWCGISEDSLEYYGVDTAAAINSFSHKMKTAGGSFNSQGLYVTLKQNEEFQKQFVLTFMDLMNNNFSPEHVSKVMEKYGEDLSWNDHFFEKRPEYMTKYLKKEFQLKGKAYPVTIEENIKGAGEITLNTSKITLADGVWMGNYFTKYPITLMADAKRGYRFVGWSGDVSRKDSAIEVKVKKGGIHIVAEYERME